MNKANNLITEVDYIYIDIRNKIYEARRKIYKHIYASATYINWYIGKIASELLGDKQRAEYGKQVVN